MNNRNTIQDELNSLSSNLAPDANGTPFLVPEGYFEGLAAAVLAKIKGEQVVSASEEIAQLSPLLAAISKKPPYSVPEHYFQSNLETLPFLISEDEESLVLSFVEKEMPYQVPAGYFANLPEQVIEKAGNGTKSGRVVSLMKRKWMRLAVAAVLTGLITISGIAYFNGKSSTSAANVPVAVELKKATTEDLKQFIKNTDASVIDQTQLTAKNSSQPDQKLFKDVSDKDLQAFLDQVPTEDVDLDVN